MNFTSAIRCTLFILLPLLGACLVHQATLDVIPASKDGTAVLQCYTYGSSPFPWPHLIDFLGRNYTTVWMKDKKLLHSDDRLDISNKTTYNFCDTFPGTSEQYTLASGLKAEGGVIKGYNIYKGFACFVSTLTINKVQESDFGMYQCNYSDFHPEIRKWDMFHYLANVTLVQTTNYISQPKVGVVQSNYVLDKDYDSVRYAYQRKRLVQCVSTGTPLDWYYVLGSSLRNKPHCDTYRGNDDRKDLVKCLFKFYGQKMSSMKSDDFYQCFEVIKTSHEPKSNQVFESFLFFKNFCVLDDLYVSCGSADGKIVDTNNAMVAIKPGFESDQSRYRRWKVEDGFRIYSGVGIFIVGSLLIAASVVACSRITCPSRVRRS